MLILSISVYAELNNVIVDMHKCGLDYVVGSTKVTSRDSISHKPGYFTRGSGLPAKVTITGIPANCVNIEKAYLWFSYSLPGKKPPKPFDVQVTNPNHKDIYRPTTVSGSGPNGEGTGWNDDSKIHHRLDITDIISGNGDYTVNVNNADAYYLDGISIIVIYTNMNAGYQGHLVINDGFIAKTDQYNYPSPVRHDFIGLNVCETTSDTRAFMLLSDMQTNQTVRALLNFNFDFVPVVRKFWNFETHSGFQLLQNQNKYVMWVEPEEPISTDQFTWLLAGIYYKTQHCFECRTSIDVNIRQTADFVCPGEEAELTANIPPNYSEADAKYEWTSEPAGFNSTQKTIKVKPTEKTKYIVNVIVGNDCLRGYQETNIDIYTPPKADAGEDIRLCGNGKLNIGKPATSGTPPYKYEWSPALGLSSTTVESPLVTRTQDISYIVKVIDGHGCTDYDTVNVTTYDLQPPKIQVIGKTDICACDYTEITTVDDYQNYKWNTGETTKSIKVNKAGEYYVTVIDKSGCTNSSEPIQINNIAATTIVSLNDYLITTKIGEDITIPLHIKSSKNLNECGLYNYEAKISFNRTILVPINNTPFGQIIEPNRIIAISGKRNPGDTVLTYLYFKAVLGNSDHTKVNLESFRWTECESSIAMIDNAVQITNLCEAGGTRLFFPNAVPNSLKQNYPNPFDKTTKIEFTARADSKAKVIISNLLGEILQTYEYDCKANSKYELNIDAFSLPAGIYCYKLIIGGEEYNRIMRKLGE